MKVNIKFITSKISIKRRSNYPCKECEKDIAIGEKYISAHHNTGFSNKPFGAFHMECFKAFKLKNKNNYK